MGHHRRSTGLLALALALGSAPPALAETLTVWTRIPEEAAKVFFDTFEKAHPDIDLQVEYIPGGKNHINKLVAAVAAGTPPDVTTIDVIATERFAQLKAFKPLDELMASDAELRADLFPQGPLATGRDGDKQYALPFGGEASVVAFNKGMFKERGLDPDRPPATWEAFSEAAQKLTFDRDGDGKPDVYGIFLNPAQPSLATFYWLPYFWMAGGEVNDRNAKTFTFASDAGEKALSFFMDLHLEYDAVPPSAIGAAGTADSLQEFLQGRVAMTFAGAEVLRRAPRDAPSIELGLMPHPTPAAGMPSTSFAGGDNVAIAANISETKLPAAVTLMKFLVSLDGQRLWRESRYFLPVRDEVLTDAFYDDHPLDRLMATAFQGAHAPPQTNHYVEVQQYLRDGFEEVAHGLAEPVDVLAEAQNRANALVKRTGMP